MMWQVVFLASLAQALAYEPIQLNYHRNVGIPLAEKIRAAEFSQDFSGARIVGGEYASLGQYPYVGGLQIILTSGATSVCGSSLVSNTKLVTSAHCWSDGQFTALGFWVVLGSTTLFTGGLRVWTQDVAVHEDFDWNSIADDIAVITIPWIEYTNVISPIALPEGYLLWLTFAGNSAQAAGFGITRDGEGISTSTVLSHVTLQVLSNLVCRDTFGAAAILDSMLCTNGAEGRGTCGGDTGGPLAVQLAGESFLIGVTSFTAAGGCEQGFPAGFTRVTAYAAWIRERL